MEQIPITFEYNAKTYSGYFKPINGGGSTTTWHLMINNYYYGQLFYTEIYGWQFHGTDFEGMGQYFGDYITAWLDGLAE